MTIIIPISGVIANFEFEEESNVTPATLRKSLEKANGEDILVTINSPGGGVFAGLEMFSLLKNYPGNVETRIVSLAASMGSVLALAGDKISAENTALYFIHNAQGIGIGDYRELAKESKFLKDISNLIANLYEKYTSLSLKDAVELMDADSQFFGKDLELLGFEIIDTEQNVDESEARINAKLKIKETYNKIKNEKYNDDLEKVAATIDYTKFGLKNEVSTPAENAGENKITGGVVMTLEELKAQHPALYAQVFNEGKEAGRKEEQDSIKLKINKAKNFVNSKEYPEPVVDMAVSVILGEKPVDILDVMVASADMFKELKKSQSVVAEQPVDTPADGPSTGTNEDGLIDSPESFMNQIKKDKGGNE